MKNKAYNAVTRLLTSKRITNGLIGQFLFEYIYERTKAHVAVLSIEGMNVGWLNETQGVGSFKVWRVKIAHVCGITALFVTVNRNAAGKLCAVEVR